MYLAESLRENKQYFEEDIGLMDEEKAEEAIDKMVTFKRVLLFSSFHFVQGAAFLERRSWGEQMTEAVEPCICIVDAASGAVQKLDNIPAGICPLQPKWLPDDQSIVFVGAKTKPYKLGLIFCFSRP